MKLSTIAAALLLAALPLAAAPAQTPDRLVFAVVVTRHGVRAILKQPAQYSWADWQPVGASFLSARGYRLMAYLGQYYRVYFDANGIPVSCTTPNAYVYADKDQRTLETGLALIEGLCGKPDAMPMHHAADLSTAIDDPLFDATQWAESEHRIDATASREAVLATLPKPPSSLVAQHAGEFAGLQRLLSARCDGSCVPVTSGDSVVTNTKEGLSELDGPVKTASTYAEDLFLEYAQCRPDASGDLSDAMRLHVLAYDVNARNRYNPRVRGGTLFAHIVAMLQTKAGQAHPGVTNPDISHDNAVIFSGHDTELGALGGILDAHWTPGGGIDADDMPPGGALVFELHKTPHDYRVRVRFVYETMEQFRHYKLIENGVASVPVRLRGCAGTDCSVPLAHMRALANSIARDGLVRDVWTPESTDPARLDPLLNPKWTQCSS